MTKEEQNKLFQTNASIRYKWLDAVLIDPNTDIYERMVAHTLVRYCGKNGRIFPSLDNMKEQVGASKMSVRRAIDKLKKKGYIHTVRQRSNNVYYFCESVLTVTESVLTVTKSVPTEHPIKYNNNNKDNNEEIDPVDWD